MVVDRAVIVVLTGTAKMKDNRCIRIVVHPLEGSPWEYVACYASEFLQAFAKMVRKAFGKRCRTG